MDYYLGTECPKTIFYVYLDFLTIKVEGKSFAVLLIVMNRLTKIYYYFHICNFKRVPSYLENFLHYETMIQSMDEKLWRVHMMNEVSRDYFQQDFPSTQKNS